MNVLALPRTIVISLVRPDRLSVPVVDMLVGLRTFVSGEYYYGTILGLTDQTGKLIATGDKIRSGFLLDRQLFPMDYRIDLNDCDPTIEVFVRGGEEFIEAKKALHNSPMITTSVREGYGRARNAQIGSSSVTLDLAQDRFVDVVEIDIRLPEAPGGI